MYSSSTARPRLKYFIDFQRKRTISHHIDQHYVYRVCLKRPRCLVLFNIQCYCNTAILFHPLAKQFANNEIFINKMLSTYCFILYLNYIFSYTLYQIFLIPTSLNTLYRLYLTRLIFIVIILQRTYFYKNSIVYNLFRIMHWIFIVYNQSKT